MEGEACTQGTRLFEFMGLVLSFPRLPSGFINSLQASKGVSEKAPSHPVSNNSVSHSGGSYVMSFVTCKDSSCQPGALWPSRVKNVNP